MRAVAKRIAALLPSGMRQSVQKAWYSYRIKTGDFTHNEPEFARLDSWVSSGDLVLDIGANLGIYTCRLSKLVGTAGRVIAFEPVPETFRYLIHNSRLFPHPNTTFLNMAVSSRSAFVVMQVPMTATGIPASALASIDDNQDGNTHGLTILCMPLDQMVFTQRITFVKIDVEGHEFQVIKGMMSIIRKDRPRFVIEGNDEAIRSLLVDELNYKHEIMPNSPNSIFHP